MGVVQRTLSSLRPSKVDVFVTDAAKDAKTLYMHLAAVAPHLSIGALLVFSDFWDGLKEPSSCSARACSVGGHHAVPSQIVWVMSELVHTGFATFIGFQGSYAFFELLRPLVLGHSDSVLGHSDS